MLPNFDYGGGSSAGSGRRTSAGMRGFFPASSEASSGPGSLPCIACPLDGIADIGQHRCPVGVPPKESFEGSLHQFAGLRASVLLVLASSGLF